MLIPDCTSALISLRSTETIKHAYSPVNSALSFRSKHIWKLHAAVMSSTTSDPQQEPTVLRTAPAGNINNIPTASAVASSPNLRDLMRDFEASEIHDHRGTENPSHRRAMRFEKGSSRHLETYLRLRRFYRRIPDCWLSRSSRPKQRTFRHRS